jgi:RHS repeat-associated protein
LTRTTFPDGTFVVETHDLEGRRIGYRDQAGNTTAYEYDLRGALTSVTDALGHTTRYAYNELDRRISQTDPLGNTTKFAYDLVGRRTLTTLPMGQTEARSYTAAGDLASLRNFNGQTTTYEYDAMTRLVRRTLPDGQTHGFTYTPTGQIASFSDASGTTTITYDLRDRPTLVRRPDGAEVRYAYDAAGNRVGLTTPAGEVAYAYDANDRLVELTDFDGRRSSFAYDAHGNRTRIEYANGVAAAYEYDSQHRTTAVVHTRGEQTLRSFQYTLGSAGHRTLVVEDTGRTVAYQYDPLFRLTQESITDPVGGVTTLAYTYDAAGNRASHTTPGGTVSYNYDANSRLVQAGPRSFVYDANGNVIARSDGSGSIDYEYDALNRLVRLASANGVTQYTYDAMGDRLVRTTAAEVVRYLVDPFTAGDLSQVLRESDAAGAIDYVHGGPVLMSMRQPAGPSFYLHDARMSTRMLADAAGDLTDSYDYDAFGNVLRRTGTTRNQHLFDGQQLDGSAGLYYLRARYYDQTIGRFTAPDPFPGVIFEPASLHPYTYAFNDPVNKSDPSGRFTLAEQMSVAATSGVLFALSYASLDYYRYRSFETAADVFLDGFLTSFAVAVDALGVPGLVRAGVKQVGAAVVDAFSSNARLVQKLTSVGKSAKTLVDEAAQRVLCRVNNKKNCGVPWDLPDPPSPPAPPGVKINGLDLEKAAQQLEELFETAMDDVFEEMVKKSSNFKK